MAILNKIKSCIKKSEYVVHETKKSTLIKFLLIIAIVVSYFIFISLRYGMDNGITITLLTWSFFVFCTPIADAGFIFDFPVRVLTKIRMIYSEIAVWCTAFLINLYFIIFNQKFYENTAILRLFKHILLHPFPFWIIIIISATGTFVSIFFADELIDVVKHKHRKNYKKYKNRYILILTLFILIIIFLFLYHTILGKLGIAAAGI